MSNWTEKLFSIQNLERCDSQLESWRTDFYYDTDGWETDEYNYDDDDLCF